MRTLKLAVAAVLLSSTAALAAPPADFDAIVAKAMAAFEVPGASIAIVEDGKTVLIKGYGTRGLEDKRPVDAQTLFDIGSCSKAFTAALVEALADDGKMTLDDKLIDRVPAFRLPDAYAASNATVRDALSHRTGLGGNQGDLLWVTVPLPRAEMLQRVRMMSQSNTFRDKFAYNNLAYAAAGEAAGQADGTSYEAALRARIFKPLGIDGAAITSAEYDKASNKALEHARIGDGFSKGKMSVIPRTRLDAIAPAGSLALSAEHLAKWITVQLADGALPDGKRLWSEARAKEMRAIQTPMPSPAAAGALAGAQSSFGGYTFGWVVFDANGHLVVTHTGGTLGASSQVAYIPDLKVGFSVTTSVGEGMMTRAVMLTLFDHYLKRDKSDRVAEVKKLSETQQGQLLEQIKKAEAGRQGDAKLPADADKLAGTWKGTWLGDVTVARDGDALTAKFNDAPNLSGKLEPWRGDTFLVRWSDRTVGNALLTFERKPTDGTPEKMTIGAVGGGASLFSGLEFRR
jgi:CubicO group peptidase (beta-lactamase class C family)